MSNRGALRGNDRWQYFKPILRVAGTGTETQPVLNDFDGTTYNNGRFVRDPDTNYVTAQMQIAFVVDRALNPPTFGEGAGPYVLRLPVPARRSVELDANRNCPIPLGKGMCYLSGSAPFVNTPVVPTLADKWASLGGEEDAWIQFYAPYILSWGSVSTTSGTEVVTSRAGFPVAASDVEIQQTNSALTLAQACAVVTASSDTTFTVRNRAGSAPGSSWTFSWKIRAEPPSGQAGALVKPGTVSAADRVGCAPFDWTRFGVFGPYPNLFVQLGYEAA